MAENIRWVIFDLGGVVVNLNIEGAWRALAEKSETDLDVLRAHLTTPDESGFSINTKMELGRISASEYIRQVRAGLNKKLSEEEIIALKMMIIQGEDERSVALINTLAAKKKIACFSNTHEIHWNHMTQHYQAFQYFEQKIASHLIQAMKPEIRAFDLATKQLATQPHECLFIDDSLPNAEAAREFGWHAIHFQNPAQLENDLIRFGLL